MKKIHFLFLAILITNYIVGQTQWNKYINNPVHGWGGQPTVIFENDTFKMWFAYGITDSLGLKIVTGYATSINGKSWTDYPGNPVLDVGVQGSWDSRVHDTPCVLRDSSGYKMWFTGADHIGFPWIDSTTLVLGYAHSNDGINWIKYPDPVLTKGDTGSWERLWLETPSVIYDEGVYKMWYTGQSTETGLSLAQVGYATSTDCINWIKYSGNPVLPVGAAVTRDDKVTGVGSVLKVDSTYMMWYCATTQADSSYDSVEVHFATSPNGINWTKYSNNPLLTPYYPSIDADTIVPWAPTVVLVNNEFYMWYEGISVATSPYTITTMPVKDYVTNITVYPNPTTNKIFLDYENIKQSILFNLHGERMCVFKGKTIDLSNHSTGIYLLHIITNQGTFTKKIIKQ